MLFKYHGVNIMRKTLGIALIFLLGLSELASGQVAEDIFKSLKKVEEKTLTGISYQDYPQVLSEAKTEVNKFLESNEARQNPQFAKHIKMAMDYYMVAKEVWDIKFNCKDDYVMEIIDINNNCGRAIKRLYPNARAEVLPGHFGPVYAISNVLRNIFNDASKELNKAKEILKAN